MGDIQFKWDAKKAIEATHYLVANLGHVDKVKLTKLLYIADRDHFLQHGHPITGDHQVAMDKGPVPSATLALLDGELPASAECYQHVHLNDFTFTSRGDREPSALSASELEVLTAVLREHGHKGKWTLVDETHTYPEFKEVYRSGTSTRIPYDTILRHYETGDGRRYRLGKPVVSRAMLAAMERPFPPWRA